MKQHNNTKYINLILAIYSLRSSMFRKHGVFRREFEVVAVFTEVLEC